MRSRQALHEFMFVFSVTNTDVHPQAAPCLVAGSGIIMILLCNAFRKKKQSTYERMLIEISDRLGEEMYQIDPERFAEKFT